jgi:hypothetical protein
MFFCLLQSEPRQAFYALLQYLLDISTGATGLAGIMFVSL